MDRLFVFAPIEATYLDPSLGFKSLFFRREEWDFQLVEKGFCLCFIRAGLFLGRHFTVFDALKDPDPFLEMVDIIWVELEIQQVEVTLGCRVVVALVAVVAKKSVKLLRRGLGMEEGGPVRNQQSVATMADFR